MQPQVVDNREAGRFELVVDDQVAGVAEYRRNGTEISLTHTEVDPAFEGRGLGSVLARGVLDAVGAEGATVLPYCTFMRGYIERHERYLDLVPADSRARFGLPAKPTEDVA